ncbi:MAG: hypothetical protein CMJ83_06185 [Planctomycetes bacterium]|nr:hypothetical protein [Planctomycetota bacterium]
MKSSVVTWLIGGALIASTGLNAHLALRVAERPAPCRTCPGPAPSAVEDLRLTDRQCDRLRECCQSDLARQTDLTKLITGRCNALEKLLEAPSTEALERAEALVDEICSARAKLLKSRIRSIDSVRQELTADQLRALSQKDTDR